ncbi:MAG: hypothetical protein JNK72_03150 [Myxococcales bacterium]|nr:hypothetical protein [Myxococcales bacterium]
MKPDRAFDRILTVIAGAALVALVLWATHFRLTLLTLGNDPDVDALAHARVARQVLTRPGNLSVHWVWLPLWHFIGAIGARFQYDLIFQRWLSVLCGVVAPFQLWAFLRRALDRDPSRAARWVPCFAAMLLTLWPGAMATFSSGEPEALFLVGFLALSHTLWRGDDGAAGLILAALCLLRYEAWTLVAAVFARALWRASRGETRGLRPMLAWVLPALGIAGWCLAHGLSTGVAFQFIKENRVYVARAWVELNIARRGNVAFEHPVIWYALLVPAHALRGRIVFTLMGLGSLKRLPRGWALFNGWLLLVITVIWLRRTNLGLMRHFTVLIPFYATLTALGVARVIDALLDRVAELKTVTQTLQRHTRSFAMALSAMVILHGLGHFIQTRWYREYQPRSATAQWEEAALGRLLRQNLQGTPCGRAFSTVRDAEVFARLPPARYLRWHPQDIRDYHTLVESVQCGVVLILARAEVPLEVREGIEVLYRSRRYQLLRRRRPAMYPPSVWRSRRPPSGR